MVPAHAHALTPLRRRVYLTSDHCRLPMTARDVRPIVPRVKLRPLVVAAVLVLFAACSAKEKPADPGLSPDEVYLVESYVRVRRAGAMFPHQRVLADSLLDRMAGEIDTVRVARTTAALNASPERWALVFQAIEARMGDPRAQPSESTRS
ncbi:MAG TPA: hypothetical protein VEC56_07535, partial [Candidatus Krumholzibacteria bacterium]|nr:hypothetical protein [Candidatus Krumholzibacteria bacterium]